MLVGNQGSRDMTLQVTKVTRFSVSEVLSMCYNNGDFSLSEDESSCDKGKGVYAYRGSRVIARKKVAALSRTVSSEPIASGSSSTSVDKLFVSADVSADAEEDHCSKVSSTRRRKQLPELDNLHESRTLCSTGQLHLHRR